MPVRNAERYVSLAVASVLGQTLSDLELIVVDDGSTDDSIDIAQRAADWRVTFVEGPRAGLGAARNAGVANSSAPLIAFMDADDLSAPTRLSEQVSALADHVNGLSAIGCSSKLIDERGDCVADAHYLQHPDAISAAAYSFMPVCGASLTIARSEFDRVGGYSGNPELLGVEDYDLICRLLRQGSRIGNLGGLLYLYRQHSASMTNTRGEQMAKAAMLVRRRHWELAPPSFSVRQIRQSRAGEMRSHASAFVQLAIGCSRRMLWLPAAKIVLTTTVYNPRGVAKLAASRNGSWHRVRAVGRRS
jgi:glycosyltransferase involved in cell wall biosynthesis